MSCVFRKPLTIHPHHRMTIKIFGSPKNVWVDDYFFSKMILHAPPAPPFLVTKNFSHHLTCPHHWMAIERGGLCYHLEKINSCPVFPPRWLKNFSHHPMVWPGVLNGDWNPLITIQRWRNVGWWSNLFGCHPKHPTIQWRPIYFYCP
jgi:hypothetical protein